MGRFRIKRGPGQRQVPGKDFRLADEVRYIQRRAAQCDSRIVSIAPLLLFSTETGDAWMLDPADHLATPIARQGTALSVHMQHAYYLRLPDSSNHAANIDDAWLKRDDA